MWENGMYKGDVEIRGIINLFKVPVSVQFILYLTENVVQSLTVGVGQVFR
jgi:hypothetical protein